MKFGNQTTSLSVIILPVTLALVELGGWIANIVKLIGSDFGGITGMIVARAIGIFVAPLGAVLGFL